MARTQPWQLETEGIGAAQAKAESEKFGSRIGPITAVSLILVALLIDGIQAFLTLIIIGVVLNWLIDIYAWFIFYFWLKLLGISMSEARGMRTLLFLGLALGFEFIPLINALPGWTAFAIGAVVNEYGAATLAKVPLAGKLLDKKAAGKGPWVATKVGNTYKFLDQQTK